MNSRDRILKTLKGEKVDRIPVSPFIWTNFANSYYSTNLSLNDEILDKNIFKIYKEIGFDPMVRCCNTGSGSTVLISYPNWEVSKKEIRINDTERTVTTTIKTPEGEMSETRQFKRVSKYDEISAETECFIKSVNDFELFERYHPPVPQYDFSRITRCKEMIGDEGVIAPWVSSTFNTCSRLYKLEGIMLLAYTDPEFYDRFMQYYSERQAVLGVQMAKAGADIITFEGNMATGTIVGPKFFEEYVLPYEQKAIRAIKEAGALVLYHNCGDCNNMFNVYNKLGISALESLTEPPYGDADIEHAVKVLDSGIGVIGNIDQIQFLLTATPEEVENRAKRIIETFRHRGRFILGTSDYLTENTPVENLKALVSAAQKYGRQ